MSDWLRRAMLEENYGTEEAEAIMRREDAVEDVWERIGDLPAPQREAGTRPSSKLPRSAGRARDVPVPPVYSDHSPASPLQYEGCLRQVRLLNGGYNR
jgi:hypothetical protein